MVGLVSLGPPYNVDRWPKGETVTFPLYRAELPASLSAGESAELAARLAALAQSGLPLEGGLMALADEVAQPRLARVLRNLAERLERGEKLESAIAAQGSRLPAHLRGLIVAGVRSGRLADRARPVRRAGPAAAGPPSPRAAWPSPIRPCCWASWLR